MTLRVGIIAGEPSGDLLGGELIASLRLLRPDLKVEGIGGPHMIAVGCHSLFPMESLSVMGVTAVIARLPNLLKIRRQIIQHFLKNPPDVFIGIDSPDFNLTIEKKLKSKGIKTVHYVSPSVWAWRRGRLKKITSAVDLMLTLFPYEKNFYQQQSTIPVEFVGHPLADLISLNVDQHKARAKLGLAAHDKMIAILPGSRSNEIHFLGELFVRTAMACAAYMPSLKFIVPLVNGQRRKQFEEILKRLSPPMDIQLIDGRSREVMAAADAVLLASGTATLECLLLKRPMVVAYRMSSFNYALAKRLIKTAYIALPNLLADKHLVPEFIQKQATVKNLSQALLSYLRDEEKVKQLQTEFSHIHHSLRHDASNVAAAAVLNLIE